MVGNRQLLQIFLVGQEQLQDMVNTPSLEQLHQRMIAATHLEPLDTDDTRAYIKYRLRCVNWKGDPLISTETYDQIQWYSHGIPRQINQLCSRLFLHGSIEEKHRLGIADLKIVVDELQQELLLPMGKEGIYETALLPAEQLEETYEEDPQASPPAPKIVLPITATLPGTDTRLHTPDRIRKRTRHPLWSGAVTVLVLVTAILAPNFIDRDSDQSVRTQETLALNQAGTQQVVQSVTEDTELTSVQPRSETPAPEEQSSSDIRNNGNEADSKIAERKHIFTTPDIETRQTLSPDTTIDKTAEQSKLSLDEPAPAPEAAPIIALPDIEPHQTLLPDTTIDKTAEQSLDEPAPALETAPIIALSQGSQAKQVTNPVPVKTPAVAPPLSEEEKIAGLLANGLRSLKSNRLLTPEDDNAYHYFQQVLELDPGNSDALHGIEQIVARYTALAINALDKNDKEKAEQYITRGFLISPNDEGLLVLRDRLNTPLFKPTVIPAPEPEPENIFMRFKAFFTQPPNENIEDQPQTDE